MKHIWIVGYLLYLLNMLTNGLFATTILIGSLLILIMLLSGRTNLKVNFYLIMLLFQLILHRIVILYISTNMYDVNISDKYPAALSIMFFPCWYLYIRTLLSSHIEVYKDLTHFIIPFFITLTSLFFFETPYKYNIIAVTTLGLYYIVIIFKLIKVKTDAFILKDKFLERWVYILYFVFVTIYFSGLILKFSSGVDSDQWLIDFYILTSIIWMFLFLYIFLNPIIMYGRILLIQSLVKQENNTRFWKFDTSKQITNKHQYIQNIIKENISDLIYKIIALQANDKLIKEHDFSVNFIASQLAIPKSHVSYLFNYHCLYKGIDYINLVKVLKSMRLITNGYLENRTIDSLSFECGFNSRITFFNNFKKLNGISPKEFAKKTFVGKIINN